MTAQDTGGPLEPCPWCGSVAVLREQARGRGGPSECYWVECDGRNPESAHHTVQSCPYATEAEAIAAWNTRRTPTSSRERALADECARYMESGAELRRRVEELEARETPTVPPQGEVAALKERETERESLEWLVSSARRLLGSKFVPHANDACPLQRHLHSDNRGAVPLCEMCSGHDLKRTEMWKALDAVVRVCPACKGEGGWAAEAAPAVVDCDGCRGRGWLWR